MNHMELNSLTHELTKQKTKLAIAEIESSEELILDANFILDELHELEHEDLNQHTSSIQATCYDARKLIGDIKRRLRLKSGKA